jgi:hypothetical protein
MKKREVIRRRFYRPRPQKRESKVWTIINSSIVIWALAAVVGSFVTFTYTNLQSCLKDADEKATRANKVYVELLDRRVDILHAINDAKTISDLSARLKNVSYTRYDFKDVPILSLVAEMKQFQTIIRKLPFAEELGHASIGAAQLTEDDVPYIEILNGGNVEGRSESFFAAIKAALPRLSIYVSNELSFAGNWAIVPYCTVGDAVVSMWKARDRILEFRNFVSPREAPFIALPPGKKK